MGNNPVSGVDPDGGFCPVCPATLNMTLNTATVTAKSVMSSGLRIGLQVGSSLMRVGNAYGQYAKGFYGALGNGLAAGLPESFATAFGHPIPGPSSLPEAVGQYAGNVTVSGVGLLTTAAGFTGTGGGALLSAVGVAPVGIPLIGVSAGITTYGLGVTGAGFIGLLNSRSAMLNMAKKGKDPMKGGGQNSRDRALSGRPDAFKNWMHRQPEVQGKLEDLSNSEVEELYDEWIKLGRPDPRVGHRG